MFYIFLAFFIMEMRKTYLRLRYLENYIQCKAKAFLILLNLITKNVINFQNVFFYINHFKFFLDK